MKTFTNIEKYYNLSVTNHDKLLFVLIMIHVDLVVYR